SSCALYAAFGSDTPAMGEVDAPVISRDTLIDAAAAHGDEHVIKFTEACLREDGIRPSPAFAAAAHHPTATLPPPYRARQTATRVARSAGVSARTFTGIAL